MEGFVSTPLYYRRIPLPLLAAPSVSAGAPCQRLLVWPIRSVMSLAAALLFLLISISWPLQAQEASVGVAVPFTITGGVFHDSDGDTSASYRAVFYPTLKLNPNWFVYSAIQIRSQPY